MPLSLISKRAEENYSCSSTWFSSEVESLVSLQVVLPSQHYSNDSELNLSLDFCGYKSCGNICCHSGISQNIPCRSDYLPWHCLGELFSVCYPFLLLVVGISNHLNQVCCDSYGIFSRSNLLKHLIGRVI